MMINHIFIIILTGRMILWIWVNIMQGNTMQVMHLLNSKSMMLHIMLLTDATYAGICKKIPGNLIFENCADATQRFLTEYAYIPRPKASLTHNFSLNHQLLGFFGQALSLH